MVLVSWQSLADFFVLKKCIVLRRINAVDFSLHTRSFGWRFTICFSLQTMIMFSIIVSLSFPLFVCLLLSCTLPASCLCFASRVAVIRGSVVLQDGSPLVGVNITFPQYPEYGYTISRQDGRYRTKHRIHMSVFPVLHLSYSVSLLFNPSFDLVTLGAMSMTLMFQRPPFLPQTRTVWTPNNNFLVLDQVTMSREEAQPSKCDIKSVLSPYPLVLPYPLPRYMGACAEKGPAVPELQV